jgi:site-specific DNA recombinase
MSKSARSRLFAELSQLLASAAEPPPLLHPNMAEIYRQRIDQLYEALQEDAERGKAAEMFRSLVDQVTLMPDDGELAIVLRGDLGAILRFAASKRDPDFLAEAEALDNGCGGNSRSLRRI